MSTLRLLSDIPVGLKRDGLGFGAYGKALASAIKATDDPLTIGIYGEWGSGKSSLMGMIKETLDEDPTHVAGIWFNAWRYEREEHPIIPLISCMVAGIRECKDFQNKFDDAAQALEESLGTIAIAFAVGGKRRDAVLLPDEAKLTSEHLTAENHKDEIQALLDRSVYFQAFEKLASVKLPEKQKIVVFVDDLDRCFPDQAIRLLESIKLVLHQPGFAFVLGADRNILEGYLNNLYKSRFQLENFNGQSYLDKIVQLPFYIPSHEGRLGEFARGILKGIGESAGSDMEPVLEIIGLACKNNPRSVIRLVNNLVIDSSINTHLENSLDVSMGVFAVTRVLQQRWPRVYAILVTLPALCQALASGDALPDDDPEAKEIRGLMEADLNLKSLLATEPARQWLEDALLRRADTTFLKAHRAGGQRSLGSTKAFLWNRGRAVEQSREISSVLQDAGFRVFRDGEDIEVGESFTTQLSKSLSEASLIVSFQGPDQKWQNSELRMILERVQRGGSLVSVLVDGASPDDLPEILQRFTYLEWTPKTPHDILRLIHEASAVKEALR